MASQFDPGQTILTLLYQQGEGMETIAQVRATSQEQLGYLTLLGGSAVIQENTLAVILGDMVERTQRLGVMHLIAEVDHKHPLLEKMKFCGFTVSAWQDIWKLGDQVSNSSSLESAGEWCPLAEVDWWQVTQLLQANIPPISQITDLPARFRSRFWVCHKAERIIAFADVRSGPHGIWIHPLFDPEVSRVGDLLCDLTQCLPARLSRPMYLSIRSYQSWLFRSIEMMNADYNSHQAILVKHLASYVKEFKTTELMQIDKRKAKPSQPITPCRISNH
ncbi:MAG: hypothetical protein JW704_10605 [Anaerolineaceae bacterium]|nr:hypothetical protein [Anaerolineaceae bacterium]MBN2677424.1 hypothetical protein [Anaerolineaceae bacterium]